MCNYAASRMMTADAMLLGLEQLSDPDFIRLQAWVKEWRVLWGLTLTCCLRLEDDHDAFVLIAERTNCEALYHLEEGLRAAFPHHVLMTQAYVQGVDLPISTLDPVGVERMERMHARSAAITSAARSGKRSPFLMPNPSRGAVATWRRGTHSRPLGQGVYLVCDACGDSTARQTTEDEVWEVARGNGWRVQRDLDVCICQTCVQNGNAYALERLLVALDT